jgi:hypothetical protein
MAYTTINKSTDYFNTKLYTGDGTSSRDITGVGFQPDWVWIKCRSNAENHNVTDSVRGATKTLEPNNNVAEATYSTVVSAFISDGFTVGNSDYVNGNTRTYASWNWLAGGTASSNTDGSITSSVSASTTSGFSIVSYTGTGSSATVGHGLGASPDLVIIKKRNAAEDWLVQTSALGYSSKYIVLNSTGASATNDGSLVNSVSSTTFSIGTNSYVNTSGHTYIAYCFAEKKGFSKFGSYTGNGSSNGPFVYTGFKPAFVLVKQSSAAGENWFICDNKREGYNAENNRLLPDASSTESTDSPIDILSNGFKARQSGAAVNGSGATYIYMAFGQSLVGSNNVPCTAR